MSKMQQSEIQQLDKTIDSIMDRYDNCLRELGKEGQTTIELPEQPVPDGQYDD